jgi:hypothetical protein
MQRRFLKLLRNAGLVAMVSARALIIRAPLLADTSDSAATHDTMPDQPLDVSSEHSDEGCLWQGTSS